MDHALFYGPRVNDNLALFTEVLGFYLAEYVTLPDGATKGALWLSCSIKAHDIAFVEHAAPGKLHHVSFLLESWETILRAGDIMSMNEVKVEIGPTRHGITRPGIHCRGHALAKVRAWRQPIRFFTVPADF